MKESGIYSIKNSINNKIYVGSSSNLKKRKYTHFLNLKKQIHHSTFLQRSFNKYGKNVFKFEILEYCDNSKLLEREQYYIDSLNPEYNICKIAGNSLGVKRTEQTKKKLSESHKGQKAWNKGIPKTKEEIENFSLKMKGRKTPKSVRLKMSNSHKKRTNFTIISKDIRQKGTEASKKKVVLIHKLSEQETIFDSLTELSKYLNVTTGAVYLAIKRKTTILKNFKVRYNNEL